MKGFHTGSETAVAGCVWIWFSCEVKADARLWTLVGDVLSFMVSCYISETTERISIELGTGKFTLNIVRRIEFCFVHLSSLGCVPVAGIC
jgi:hypothetical protein